MKSPDNKLTKLKRTPIFPLEFSKLFIQAAHEKKQYTVNLQTVLINISEHSSSFQIARNVQEMHNLPGELIVKLNGWGVQSGSDRGHHSGEIRSPNHCGERF